MMKTAKLRLSTGCNWKSSSNPHIGRFLSRNASSASAPIEAISSTARKGLYAAVFTISVGIFGVYYFDSRSAMHRYVFTPLVRHALDAEKGHWIAVKTLRSGLGPRDTQVDDGRLKAEIWGQEMSNPVGLAAGFDKNGEAIDGCLNLGFSWIEIGSVTPKPQPGNPKPRLFRLVNDAAIINRYGFPSEGHASVLSRLRARLPTFPSPNDDVPASLKPGALLAVNLGKNKSSPPDSIDDFVTGVHAFGPYADVLVVNVSSPNTPGLRGLQSRALLEELLSGVIQARDEVSSTQGLSHKPKVVLKIAPDLDDAAIADIAAAVRSSAIDGVIVSNTTVRRPSSLTDENKYEGGGLSGPPLKPYALATLRALRGHLPASVPLIGCGGISTGADALDYARAGACAVQLYTSFAFDGVGACRRIKDELTEALKKEGKTWTDVVQKATAELSLKPTTPAPNPPEGSVRQLIQEADELKRLLDKLGERYGVPGDDVAAVVATSV